MIFTAILGLGLALAAASIFMIALAIFSTCYGLSDEGVSPTQ